MRRSLTALISFTLISQAFAGGWEGGYNPSGPQGLASCGSLAGQYVPEGTTCVDNNGVVVVTEAVIPAGTVIEVRRGRFCTYPHRPSDSVFIGGSGYLLKDSVRAVQGCL